MALALSVALSSSALAALDKELNLPELGLTMKYPSSWTVIDSKTMAAAATAAEGLVDPADEASAEAIKGVSTIAENKGFSISKYSPMSNAGTGPTFLYAPLPLPADAKLDEAPPEKKMMILKVVVAPMMIEGMKSSASVNGLSIIEQPSIIDGNRGVWFTVKGVPADGLSKEPGGDKEQVIRVYMFAGKRDFSIVTINYPADGSEKEAEALLWEMVGSLKL